MTGMWVGWWVIRNRPPDHIARWERGAWGEQLTAVDLKPLKKEGWVVRHDLDTGFGNRDHVLAGPAVYLLDTKHHIDDRLTPERAALRVQRVDQPRDSYLLDRITPAMQRAARKLSAEIFRDTGERVWVYPVVVLWGYFEDGVSEADGVFYVDGEKLTARLRNRPVDLYNRRREVIENWLRHWHPPASGNA